MTVSSSTGVSSVDGDTPVDGRKARRQRNRDALVEAWLETVAEGDLEPSVAVVAEKSGISYRSVFRYFENINELFLVAAERYGARTDHLADIDDIGVGTFDDRVESFVDHRVAYFDAMGALGRASRMRAPVRPEIKKQLDTVRDAFREQMKLHFATELAALPRSEAGAVRSAVDSLVSFEAYDIMRTSQGLSRDEAVDSMTQALKRLLH